MIRKLKQILILLVVSLFCISCSSLPTTENNPWQAISLPTESTFADIAFTEDLNQGWLVGTQATLFETTDGGDSWQEKNLELGDAKVSFTSVSFKGNEGWIVGKPSILLHTDDGGQNWSRILLSEKLPGSPYGILALGPQSAEMVTDLGAIYQTTDGGLSWKGLVEGAVGVARTITRSPNGEYVAVSARGNFYSTWKPGDSEWTPHDRNSSRRIQNMGFSKDDRLWLLARGGQIQFTQSDDFEDWGEVKYPEASTSWGLLDIGFRTSDEMWVAGGSGNLLLSTDFGDTWQKDQELEKVPSNLNKIVFVNDNMGFILGQKGILLKYDPSVQQTQAFLDAVNTKV